MGDQTMTCGECCSLFCCPPWPPRIASKMAFLPPEPTYTMSTDDNGASYNLHLSDSAEFQYSQKELDSIEVFKSKTKRGNRISLMFVRCAGNAKFTLLFSHGNAVDLGQMSSFFIGLGTRLKCNLFSYDYSGYGVSDGKPSESNLYHDIDTAFFVLRTRYTHNPEQIVLYGQSIGTVPTIDLAQRHEVAGVILHSPLLSGLRIACPSTNRTWCCDAFANIDKVPKIKSPVLVIHGTDDEVIDFSHGLEIYDKAPITVEPLWVEGAGHNDVELYGPYLDRMKRFLDVDLPAILQKNNLKTDEVKIKNSNNESRTSKEIKNSPDSSGSSSSDSDSERSDKRKNSDKSKKSKESKK